MEGGSLTQGGASKKTAMGRELGQSITRGRKSASGQGSRWPSHGGKSAKGPGERGQELKVSRHGYN